MNKKMPSQNFSDAELNEILEGRVNIECLRSKADFVRKKIYGRAVFVRGLIEFSNFCKNDCFYCGLRFSNKNVSRFRLSKKEIFSCCKKGYALGARTFVLQSGEDFFFSENDICEIVQSIKNEFPDCAITLSVGERSRSSYKKFFDAGASRYLLRQESANPAHYSKLHPKKMCAENRKRCLFDLKEIGFQVGAGFMVGSPFQTNANIIEDLRFMQNLNPDMIGIGPFVRHKETPFSNFENGSVEKTLALLCVLRLMFPRALIPATTALSVLDKKGSEKGLQHGANVLMPNISPAFAQKKYSIYDGKTSCNFKTQDSLSALFVQVQNAGYKIVIDRGDAKKNCDALFF